MSIIDLIKTTIPKYDVSIPSTNSKTSYRPFLMKEQKVLMMASDQSEAEILKAISAVVENCVDNVKDAKQIPLYDLEYLFCQIRAKSVSEMVEPIFTCPYTGEKIKVGINLKEIKPNGSPPVGDIAINEKITIKMRSPTVKDHIQSSGEAFDVLLSSCIEKIMVDDEVFNGSEMPIDEKLTILENLTKDQYEKLEDFIYDQPSISVEVPYRTTDKVERKIRLEGIRDFFG